MGLPKKMPLRDQPEKHANETPDDQKRVVVNRYRIERKLGSGNFGTAFLAKDLKTKDLKEEFKVLKEIPCRDLQPDETVDAMHEAKLLANLHNAGIVKFYDSFLDGENFCIVTEYCEGGDLDDYITRMRNRGEMISEKQIMDWTVQLLHAVHYMHTRRVLHRDLKARNIFLKKNHTKIGDFGISRILMGTNDMASTFTGTPYYMSPEVLKHEGYNSKSDVWSIGCIVYELCCQKHAFMGQGLMGVMYKIVEGETPVLTEKYSRELNDILQQIFIKDPQKRPSALEVLKLSYVSKHFEKMKSDSVEEQSSKDAEADTRALEKTLQKKVHRRDLQIKSEEDKLKNLTPRERMRLQKQREADKRMRELAEASKANLQANLTRKRQIKETTSRQQPAPWVSAGPIVQEETTLRHDNNTNQGQTNYQFSVGQRQESENTLSYSAPTIMNNTQGEASDEEDVEDEEETILSKTAPAGSTVKFGAPAHRLLGSYSDNRPITPMKDRMVYDVKHSSLDFKDGVPEDPRLADTYYSQFEDEFDDRGQEQSDHSSSDVTDESSDHGIESSEESDMIQRMEEHLTTADEGDVTLTDDHHAGAFGPAARANKIKRLRQLCEQKLGKLAFKKAYAFLKEARFGSEAGHTIADDGYILSQLRSITPLVSDCFLIDQLLFLEKQAEVENI